MQFVYPGFLWALTLLAIPIVIHLFHFRRYKKVIFPNVQFLQNLQKETQSVKKIRNLLVLISRLLALAFLILAFAQPFIPVGKTSKTPQSVVSIYLDNSFSMERKSVDGPVFEVAKEKARQIVSAYPNSTRFQIIGNEGRGASRSYNADDAIEQIDQMSISPVSSNLSDITRLLKFGLDKLGVIQKDIYLVSDFQKREEKAVVVDADSTFKITAVPVNPVAESNISIDSVWLDDPHIQLDKAFNLHVKIHNHGVDDITESTISLNIGGVRKSAAGFDLAPGASREITMGVTLNETGWQSGVLSLEDEALVFDNLFYLTFNIKESIKILAVNGKTESEFLNRLFRADKYYELSNATKGNMDLREVENADLVILNAIDNLGDGLVSELRKYCEQGGTVLVIPGEEPGTNYLKNVTSTLGLPEYGKVVSGSWRVSTIDRNHPIFKNIFTNTKSENTDYSRVESYYQLSKNAGSQAVMKLQNGDLFLAGNTIGRGNAFSLACPLNTEWSSLPNHAIFLPLVYEMSMNRSSDLPLYYNIGRNNLFRSVVDIARNPGELKLKTEEREWMPVVNNLGNSSYIDAGGEDVPAANIRMFLRDSLVQVTSFNYSRQESGQQYYTSKKLEEIFQGSTFLYADQTTDQLTHTITRQREGRLFWKWCVILCLIFLAIEILLLRLWPNRPGRSPIANNPTVE